jgi:hypothetical protein
MTNISLLLEIYRYVTLEDSKSVRKIDNGPKIVGGNDALREIRDQFTAEFYWALISPNQTVPVELSVKSSGESPEGTFFIRSYINFIFNNTSFEMKSRGHFTNQEWEDAQPSATEDGVVYNDTGEIDKFIVGRLDLEALGVDGVIPDTSIRIKNPIPLWPFYLGVGGAILFLVLAFVFYLMDEKGKFPNAKKKLDGFSEKMKNFRYRRE